MLEMNGLKSYSVYKRKEISPWPRAYFLFDKKSEEVLCDLCKKSPRGIKTLDGRAIKR